MRLFRLVVVLTLSIVTFLFVAPSTFAPALVQTGASALAGGAPSLPADRPIDDATASH